MWTPKILIIEPDAALAQAAAVELRASGYEPLVAASAQECSRVALAEIQLCLLALALPDAHGLDVLKAIRRTSDVPVIVVSKEEGRRHLVRAFELGADDYLTHSYDRLELIARVRARLRSQSKGARGDRQCSALKVDRVGRRVLLAGKHVPLTRLEFELLARLMQRPGVVVERYGLAAEILDPNRDGTPRTLDVHVSRLRKKLGEYGRCIETVRGVGYRFEADRSETDVA